jgi:thymidylate synthase
MSEESIVCKADDIFIKMCKDILENGISSEGEVVRAVWADGMPAYTIKKFAIINRYDLSEEFPILTLRPTNLKAAIDELLWIWQKKSNNINELNSGIWDSWANEEGSIGKAYGYQLKIKHKYHEGEFDQVDRVLFDLKNTPYSRRIIVNMYNHNDLHEMNLYPCAYSLTFNVTSRKLNAILNQRSQDILVANNWNVCQYAILVHMLAQVSNLEVGEFVHVIADAHIYDRHIPLISELIQRTPYPAPKLLINTDKKDFYDFKVEDFVLEGYQSGPQIRNIPVAV